jgi:hypothetical protein
MPNSEGPFDWEDENDPVFISDEDYSGEESTPLEDFRRLMIQDRIISDFVNEAWDFGGIATIADVVNHIERKIGWRTEIIADKSALDDYMFFENDVFDRDIWDTYTNSDEFQELVYEVAYQSEFSMRLFAKRECGQLTVRDRFKIAVRNLLYKLARYFD